MDLILLDITPLLTIYFIDCSTYRIHWEAKGDTGQNSDNI